MIRLSLCQHTYNSSVLLSFCQEERASTQSAIHNGDMPSRDDKALSYGLVSYIK